jgi:microcystin-dependent protein
VTHQPTNNDETELLVAMRKHIDAARRGRGELTIAQSQLSAALAKAKAANDKAATTAATASSDAKSKKSEKKAQKQANHEAQALGAKAVKEAAVANTNAKA